MTPATCSPRPYSVDALVITVGKLVGRVFCDNTPTMIRAISNLDEFLPLSEASRKSLLRSLHSRRRGGVGQGILRIL